ncbi:hypothetical protein [Halapricum desulfuricans]|uniref:DUF8120 domain-containing protein n=1 Tax=Halapricum desulfuricans TaxID=2841257 RepID=A0A897NVI0_9EURY|nr:hypothetical protein [Halapricum desulfuricans]QSG14773.1 Uncharacterized protein HSEST_1240 [Halapricum desulfuricans]
MTEIALSARTYSRLDTASKLLGLALVAAGLEVGPTGSAGATLVVVGIAIGTITVFITTNE